MSPLAGLAPRGRADAVAANDAAFREIPTIPGLLQYVIVNPIQSETYGQALRMLRATWCVGIKIHPEEHHYSITDCGDELFRFFGEVGAPVMTHSGDPNSLPEAFVPFANRHPRVRLLLAHLGNGGRRPAASGLTGLRYPGSDSPLYHVAMQRARIEAAEISDEAKQRILRDNAIAFFGLAGSGGSE